MMALKKQKTIVATLWPPRIPSRNQSPRSCQGRSAETPRTCRHKFESAEFAGQLFQRVHLASVVNVEAALAEARAKAVGAQLEIAASMYGNVIFGSTKGFTCICRSFTRISDCAPFTHRFGFSINSLMWPTFLERVLPGFL